MSAHFSSSDSVRSHTLSGASVTAQRMRYQETMPAQSLSGEQLRRLSAHSVADAIRYFSGVQIKDYGGIGGLKTVNIRSLGTNHVGVFYDGIQLGNAQNGQIDLGRFSLENMEAVSVYNGQRGTIFQSAKDFGSASSVYLQSREPSFEEGERHHFRATFKTGSFSLSNPSFVWEERMGHQLRMSTSGEFMQTTGQYRFSYRTRGGYDTTSVRRNGDVRAFRIENALFGTIDNGDWKTKAYFYQSERGLPGAVVRGKFTHEDRQWDTNFFLQASVRKRFSSHYRNQLNLKYAYDYLHYLSDPHKDVSLMYVNNVYRQQEAYFSTTHEYAWNGHFCSSLSADYQYNHLSSDMYQFTGPLRHTLYFSTATEMQYGNLKVQATVLGVYVCDKEKRDTIPSAWRHEWTPSLLVTYRPFGGRDFFLRSFYKRIFRMPTLNDLYYTLVGSSRLNPESAYQYDAGFVFRKNKRQGLLRGMEIQADVYYNKVRDKIVAIPTSNQFRWTMMNLGRVDILGLDVALQTLWRPLKDVDLGIKANYTYQKAKDVTDRKEPFYGDQIPYVPFHSASLVLNGSWRHFGVNYSFIYTGKRWDQRANIPENFAPEWYTNDMSVSYDGQAWKKNYRVTAEVNNLFNQQFEVVKGYPMPGTNIKLIVNLFL